MGCEVLLISLPADFTTRDTFSYSYKDNDSGRFGKWPGIGRDGGGGRRMEVVGCQDDTISALGGFA